MEKLTRKLSPEAQRLVERIGQISEECYCAGWLNGIEKFLWAALQRGKNVDYGFGRIDRSTRENLWDLSRQAGGWVVWREENEWFKPGPGFIEFDDPRFETLVGSAQTPENS